ncbi:glycosyl transferase [Pokkaliibacter sp. CJK22405]|uniref:glycosyl transferase n=1 Tax=Pokkaliibacter sp. CJK22405 TaxID=3384615 RepID=UPI0039855002
MSDQVKQVICIKWGTRYGPEYVNRIYSMVERNITPPFRVYCLTDDSAGVREEVICRGLPDLGVPRPTNAPGKWPKTAMWGDSLFDIEGVVLFIDLDVIITGNIDDFFSMGKPEDVIVARNWVKPLERLGQTSIFRFEIGRHGYMLNNFRKDPEGIAGKYQFEQRYVTQCIEGGVKFWPRGWVRHFRMDCLGPWPLRYLRPPKLPKGSRVVIFPGKPDPSDALVGRWSDQIEPGTRGEHLRRFFKGEYQGNGFRFLKRFMMPAEWIRQHWR